MEASSVLGSQALEALPASGRGLSPCLPTAIGQEPQIHGLTPRTCTKPFELRSIIPDWANRINYINRGGGVRGRKRKGGGEVER